RGPGGGADRQTRAGRLVCTFRGGCCLRCAVVFCGAFPVGGGGGGPARVVARPWPWRGPRADRVGVAVVAPSGGGVVDRFGGVVGAGSRVGGAFWGRPRAGRRGVVLRQSGDGDLRRRLRSVGLRRPTG